MMYKKWWFYLALYALLVITSNLFFVNKENDEANNFEFLEINYGAKKPGLINFRVEGKSDSSKEIVLFIKDLKDDKSVENFFFDLKNILGTEYSYILPNYLSEADNNSTEFSAEKNATAVANLINQISAHSKVNIIAKGTGGKIAIELSRLNILNIKSYSFLNAYGIENLELLGSNDLNVGVFAAQKLVNWTVLYLTPHFGALNGLYKNIIVADFNYETEQENYDEYLRKIKSPVLILQSNKITSFNKDISYEHYRLIPQSKLIEVPANKGEGFEFELNEIANFIRNNESPYGPISTENTLRELRAIPDYSRDGSLPATGTTLIGILILIFLITTVSEELSCIATGLLIAQGLIGIYGGLLACLSGIFVFDVLIYLFGRVMGTNALRIPPFSWFISEKDIINSTLWFDKRGPSIIILSRFIPGTRFGTYITSGVLQVRIFTFMIYFGVSSFLYALALIALAFFLGQELLSYFYLYQDYALWALAFLVLAIMLFLKVGIPLLTHYGRKRLFAQIRSFLRRNDLTT